MNQNRALFIAVHPDDETLACGGTILRHKAAGDHIYWMIVTNMQTENGFSESLVAKRQKEIDSVAKAYDFDKTIKLDFPTTKLDEIPLGIIVSAISDVISEIKPNIIYLPNSNDVHSDHKIAFQAAYSCTKNFRYPFINRILMGEVMSETEFAPALASNAFTPNVFINIEDYIEKKLEIMSLYENEVMLEPKPRSLGAIRSLASFRGSSISKQYAEAFMLLKEINY